MKNVWVSESTLIEKPWGSEKAWTTCGQIFGKVLYIKEGHRTSLKYNKLKNETLFVLSGRVLLTYANEKFKTHQTFVSTEVQAGGTIHVQSECPYRLRALEDSIIIEIGDKAEPNPIRFHDDYDRVLQDATYNILCLVESANSSATKLKDT